MSKELKTGAQGGWEVIGDSYRIREAHGLNRQIGQAYVMNFGLDYGGKQLPDDEGKANALLMAAAPDLLMACIDAIKVVWDLTDFTATNRDAYEKLKQAIHKALNPKP